MLAWCMEAARFTFHCIIKRGWGSGVFILFRYCTRKRQPDLIAFSFFKRVVLSCIEILDFLMGKSNFKAIRFFLDFFMRDINLSLCGLAHNQRVFYGFIIFFALSGFFNSFEVNWNPKSVMKVKRCLRTGKRKCRTGRRNRNWKCLVVSNRHKKNIHFLYITYIISCTSCSRAW